MHKTCLLNNKLCHTYFSGINWNDLSSFGKHIYARTNFFSSIPQKNPCPTISSPAIKSLRRMAPGCYKRKICFWIIMKVKISLQKLFCFIKFLALFLLNVWHFNWFYKHINKVRIKTFRGLVIDPYRPECS